MSNLIPKQPIVIRLPNWIGDACMTLPALHLLHQFDYSLILVGKPWIQELFKDLPHCTFVPLSGSKSKQTQELKTFLKSYPKKLKGIIFTNSFSSALLFKRAGIRSVGYRTDLRRFLLKKSIVKPDNLHEVEVFYKLTVAALSSWGHIDIPTEVPKSLNLPQSFETHRQALTVLESAGVNPPFVLIAPTVVGKHQGQIKAWEHFAEFARQLKQLSYICVMCPVQGEAESLRKLVPDAICLPTLSLDIFTALLHQASLVVCNDSGTSHLAAAVGAQQVTIFGVTNPERTGPWSEQAHKIGTAHTWPSLDTVLMNSLAILRGERHPDILAE